MALFMKQDFTPPVLSRRWIAMKFRPNMLVYSRNHIISILESGLMFREDSVEVEQEAPSPEDVWKAAGGSNSGWFTTGEKIASAVAVTACIAAYPPRNFQRSTLITVAAYVTIPLILRASHRAMCRGALADMLASMRDYLALARRAAACIKEYAALHTQLDSLSSVVESTRTMLCRQQSELTVTMCRASSALLGNAPWLRSDVAWEAVTQPESENLMRVHHAFLVVQSTLLKHIAMAHYIPSVHAQKLYKNHNERIHWIHNVLITHITEEIRQNYEALERMYRLLKNSGTKDNEVTKKLGKALKDSWVYSDVHSGVAGASLELKIALNKCNSLDVFLDSCALNKQELNLDILNKDVDDLIDNLTKCLTTVQNSQLRLRKLRNKVTDKEEIPVDNTHEDDDKEVLKIENKIPETKDEVFYFVKTEDDVAVQPADDLTTAPGKKEKEATKVVLNELKRKLGKREDVMRERERQALVKTMPDLKEIPEFPRQIKFEEFVDRKGYISKLKRSPKKKLFRHFKIKHPEKIKNKKYKLKVDKYVNENDISDIFYEANSKFNVKCKLISVVCINNNYFIKKWCKDTALPKDFDSSGVSEGLSDVEAGTVNRVINQAHNDHVSTASRSVNDAKNIRFTKKDLELSPSSSESDFEFYKKNQKALLNDIRRHRVTRKKNVPAKRLSIDNVDESLKPIEYSFGTGMAMASVLQINSNAKLPYMAQEEVFIGDGEVSEDSGNDADA